MGERQAPRQALRQSTLSAHERVDALFSRADLTDRAEYTRFLAAQAAAFVPIERALEAGGAAVYVADWPSRRRIPHLRADLAALGVAEPVLEPEPTLRGEPAVLGAVYVLEGSRLGGAMLRRSVPDDFPTAFLTAGRPGAWREFVEILDERLTSDEGKRIAVETARAVFELFEAAAKRLI